MKNQLKTVIIRGINDQDTTTLLDEVHSSRTQVESDKTEIQDPDILAMREDFMALRNLGKERNEASDDTSGHSWPEPRKYDRDGMTDQELERVSVWLETNDDALDEEDNPTTKKRTKSEEKEKFDEYKHHQYVKRWGLLFESNGKDEEWFIPSPPTLAKDDPGYLCDMCRHIDFDVLLTQRGLPGNQKPGLTSIQLYGFAKVMTEESCSFCTLLREAVLAQCPPEQLPALSRPDVMSKTITMNVIDEGPEYGLRLEVEFGTTDNEEFPRVIVQKAAGAEALPLQGLPVCQNAADTERLRGWVKACEEDHPRIYNSRTEPRALLTGVSRLRIIDTELKCVVWVDMPCRYTCLSYVWGTGTQTLLTASTREVLEAPGGLDDPSLNLHQTIKHSVEATRQIGIRYIWIDALCILQDDPSDKAAIISKMGSIYGNSTLDIVASTNSDPRDGLPGIGSTARARKQVFRHVQGISLSAAFHDSRRPLTEIEDSVWNSRAWTFQERRLSPRSVYFTSSQMYFTCPHGAAYEDTIPIQDATYKPSPLNNQTRVSARLHDLHFHIWADVTQSKYPNKSIAAKGEETTTIMIAQDPDNPDQPNPAPAPTYRYRPEPDDDTLNQSLWKTYTSAVEQYTQRKMTWQTDALNAFSGVADLISRGINTKFWYGLPEFSFDQALLWHPRRALLSRRSQIPSIPSWSWAAWQGHSSYRGRGYHNAVGIPPAPVVRWLENYTEERILAEILQSMGGNPTPEQAEEAKAKAKSLCGSDGSALAGVDPYALWKIREGDEEPDGWVLVRDEKRNEHLYEHPGCYPGIKFTMPGCLPFEQIIERPSAEDGTLYFFARMTGVVFTEFQLLSNAAGHSGKGSRGVMQIGVGDEHMSANYRPAWQRILYSHQGYRAGFLYLNSDFDDDEREDTKEFGLVAMSQDSLSHMAPPVMGWEAYWAGEPRLMHAAILRHDRLEWEEIDGMEEEEEEEEDEKLDWDEKSHVGENGDPHWDEERFGEAGRFFDVYNVLLLVRRKTAGEEGSGPWERAGVGKVSRRAFRETRARERLVILR
ncbi:heterokaryon incompatibility protein 6, OR allele [Cladorrhinum sp. PSN332]|nr:heterokaryon incompatibility protein 6, OR allele [Cladorrhinum sp. PSN332]